MTTGEKGTDLFDHRKGTGRKERKEKKRGQIYLMDRREKGTDLFNGQKRGKKRGGAHLSEKGADLFDHR
ncbi:hypothetical protein, partial [Pseudomonas sp. GM78]|uniref:hypothetical protein n=1 Tax=Pseudomonas sp. GM78 TaxID=1144337 RepID=UPI001EE69295